MALQAYRNLLRATRLAFANDSALLHASREQARSTFHQNGRLLAPHTPEAEAQIQHAEEVAKVLRKNVVQGQRVGETDGDGMWRLRLHEEIERGDNASVKNGGKGCGR